MDKDFEHTKKYDCLQKKKPGLVVTIKLSFARAISSSYSKIKNELGYLFNKKTKLILVLDLK